MGVFLWLLSGIVILLTFIYFNVKRKYSYWKKKKLPHLEPTLLLGNFGDYLTQKEFLAQTVAKICKKFPDEPFVGAYIGTEPVLIAKSPEAVRMVSTKEFPSFNSRELMDYSERDIFGQTIINSCGESWKFARTNLTPLFSTAKLKKMFPLIEDYANDFERHLDTEIKGNTFEARSAVTSFTMNSIVSCAFGIDLKNSKLKKTFHDMGNLFFDINWIRSIILNIRLLYPKFFFGIGLKSIPDGLVEFFRKLLTEVFEARGNKPSNRNDFVDGLLSLIQNPATEGKRVDENYLIAQSIAIFVAGFETSATTLSFALYELAKNQDVQEKVHKEIDAYLEKTEGKTTFDCVTELPYLEACIYETLRLYPILGVITREVSKNFVLPSGVELEKGLRVHFPVTYLHHNPDLFPEPEVFRPERFYGDTKQEVQPSSFLPFGDGPRLCIGKRFAKLQTMAGLLAMLKSHKVILSEDKPTLIEYECKSFTTQFKSGIHLRRVPRK